jgi:hypothetical protein
MLQFRRSASVAITERMVGGGAAFTSSEVVPTYLSQSI